MAHQFHPPVKNYEIIEHTADLALRVNSKDLAGLFRNTALALFKISAKKKPSATGLKKETLPVIQKADTLDELFIIWLNELLSLSAAKGLVFTDFKIGRIDEKALEATAIGEDAQGFRLEKEIKAATYHGLKLKKAAEGWQAEVILDV